MPSPRRMIHARREESWGDRHFAFLLSGIDWPFLGASAWGDLSKLDDAALAEAVSDMVECFATHGDHLAELTEGIHHEGPAWFAQYADDPAQLIAEVNAQREYSRRYPHGDRCRCPSCKSQPPSAATAATT